MTDHDRRAFILRLSLAEFDLIAAQAAAHGLSPAAWAEAVIRRELETARAETTGVPSTTRVEPQERR